MIFLSASIPTPGKESYYQTADAMAIQAAVRATVQVVVPKARLIWGGHPAITTIIHHTIGRMQADLRDLVTMYQSDYFKAVFPKEHRFFTDVKTVAETADKKVSITKMRHRMIEENDFKAAIFIGGMKGVEKEYEIFRSAHPQALLLPVASTGAAAKTIYEQTPEQHDNRLLHDHEYVSLFQSLLQAYL
ncbi:MAG: Uncharacterized protein K0R51_3321 [Cytophagaceae bacterium]|jgi:hypothetical protein|nr:Uncharacterized protein [Cytophagaceae bacterium]